MQGVVVHVHNVLDALHASSGTPWRGGQEHDEIDGLGGLELDCSHDVGREHGLGAHRMVLDFWHVLGAHRQAGEQASKHAGKRREARSRGLTERQYCAKMATVAIQAWFT